MEAAVTLPPLRLPIVAEAAFRAVVPVPLSVAKDILPALEEVPTFREPAFET
jgi:hypothetical protein